MGSVEVFWDLSPMLVNGVSCAIYGITDSDFQVKDPTHSSSQGPPDNPSRPPLASRGA